MSDEFINKLTFQAAEPEELLLATLGALHNLSFYQVANKHVTSELLFIKFIFFRT